MSTSKANFFQDGPVLSNTFLSDPYLARLIDTRIPEANREPIRAHLKFIGEKACSEWLTWSRQAESFKPKLKSFDPWGRRVDEIETHPSWTSLGEAAAVEGLVATAYERKYQESSRLYQSMLLYIYHSSSAFFSCPLAMTDGAARALELHGDYFLKNNALPRLTSRDPKLFWTSGQWMTERTGGSDVSATSTIAKKGLEDREYHLFGTKWFTSATTSQMALTLARIEGDPEGNRGLSLFYLELRNADNKLNQIEVHRLKDKLGTDALPTAELTLNGTAARLIGAPGEGVKRITSVLNITRIYNSICALSHMRRALDLAKNYSQKRYAFGAYLIEHTLHRQTLEDLEIEFEACFKLTFFVSELLGKEEFGTANDFEKKLLRALTPIVKLYTAKKSILISSEVLEVFGGAGYVEDTGIPRLLRDAQVFSIWEGTTNILTLDFYRVCEKDDALETIKHFLQVRGAEKSSIAEISDPKFKDLKYGREFVFRIAEAIIQVI